MAGHASVRSIPESSAALPVLERLLERLAAFPHRACRRAPDRPGASFPPAISPRWRSRAALLRGRARGGRIAGFISRRLARAHACRTCHFGSARAIEKTCSRF
jgi:hypothetical protein